MSNDLLMPIQLPARKMGGFSKARRWSAIGCLLQSAVTEQSGNNIQSTVIAMMPPPHRGQQLPPFQQQVVYSLPQPYAQSQPLLRPPPQFPQHPPPKVMRLPGQQLYPPQQHYPAPPPQFYQQRPLPPPPQQYYRQRVAGGYPGYTMAPRDPYYHPRYDYNLNFNYEEANFLCDTKIVENKIFCVICGADYLASERDQHLQRHIRKGQADRAVEKIEYKSSAPVKGYQVRPIVEPDQHYVQEPIVYNFVQEILYEDPEPNKDECIEAGYEGQSFDNGPNISMDYGRDTRIPEIRTENNPFRNNRGERVAEVPAYSQGNTLNEPSYSQPRLPNRSNLSNNNEDLVIDEGQNEYHPGNNKSLV